MKYRIEWVRRKKSKIIFKIEIAKQKENLCTMVIKLYCFIYKMQRKNTSNICFHCFIILWLIKYNHTVEQYIFDERRWIKWIFFYILYWIVNLNFKLCFDAVIKRNILSKKGLTIYIYIYILCRNKKSNYAIKSIIFLKC